MPNPVPRLRGWYRVFGHPSGERARNDTVPAVQGNALTRHNPDECSDPGAHIVMDPTVHVHGLPEALKGYASTEDDDEAYDEWLDIGGEGDGDVVR